MINECQTLEDVTNKLILKYYFLNENVTNEKKKEFEEENKQKEVRKKMVQSDKPAKNSYKVLPIKDFQFTQIVPG